MTHLAVGFFLKEEKRGRYFNNYNNKAYAHGRKFEYKFSDDIYKSVRKGYVHDNFERKYEENQI